MGCCLGREGIELPTEVDPLLNDAPQKNFRQGRSVEDFDKHKIAKNIFQCVCASLCLWKPSGWGLCLSFFLALICIFQLVYDLFVISGCPGFDCGFLEKKLEEIPKANVSRHESTFRKTSNTVYTLASIGGLFSYTFLLISLMLIKRRRRFGNKAVGPSDSLYDDVSNSQMRLMFSWQVIMTVIFLSAIGLFYYLVHKQPKDGWYFYLMVTGVAAQFIAQWAAIVGCHVFAVSSLTLGTLANDTIRRIKQMEIARSSQESGAEQDGQNGSQNRFDIALGYHEELCLIVSDTVTAYCPWFVVHWFCYGATCLIGIIYISEEFTYSANPFKLAYVSVFLGTHMYLFLFPCCCAAYITDTCGGIYSRINKTTSGYWTEGHPFKERAQLTMFTSYAKDRQCVFKIGRLTFTSTLAWFSLLLGSTGILFHFF